MLRKKVDDEGNELDGLDLEIQGIIFSRHPFVSKDFGKCNLG